jgi:myo-inositol-1(or 4)-monophosphatase
MQQQNLHHKEALRQVILQAGALAKDYFRRSDGLDMSKKGPKDLVTEADIKVENFIRRQFTEQFPGYGFWGEESGAGENLETCWIVDPIDGTHSFFRGQYFWSISIALRLQGEIVLGAVYAPALGDLYLGEKNKGAWKNGNPIVCSATEQLSEAMVCTGFACLRSNLENNNLDRFSRVALQTRDQRRFGSAALDLCMVADGQLDAFWEQHLNLYDVAAGVTIALEAGATISDFKGQSVLNPEEVVVTNGRIHQQLLKLM